VNGSLAKNVAGSYSQKRSKGFIRHIFSTLTYDPKTLDQESRSLSNGYPKIWEKVSVHFNRFVQEWRRSRHVRHLDQKVQFLRSIEAHKNGYPHIHCLIQYNSACIAVYDRRYFDNLLYAEFRSLWKHGLSDFQVPRAQRIGQINYILKYISKNATSNTLWKKILSINTTVENAISVDSEQSPTQNDLQPESSCSGSVDLAGSTTPISPVHHPSGIKYLSWSRGFDFRPFSDPHH